MNDREEYFRRERERIKREFFLYLQGQERFRHPPQWVKAQKEQYLRKLGEIEPKVLYGREELSNAQSKEQYLHLLEQSIARGKIEDEESRAIENQQRAAAARYERERQRELEALRECEQLAKQQRQEKRRAAKDRAQRRHLEKQDKSRLEQIRPVDTRRYWSPEMREAGYGIWSAEPFELTGKNFHHPVLVSPDWPPLADDARKLYELLHS
jgi:hypothetical protein